MVVFLCVSLCATCLNNCVCTARGSTLTHTRAHVDWKVPTSRFALPFEPRHAATAHQAPGPSLRAPPRRHWRESAVSDGGDVGGARAPRARRRRWRIRRSRQGPHAGAVDQGERPAHWRWGGREDRRPVCEGQEPRVPWRARRGVRPRDCGAGCACGRCGPRALSLLPFAPLSCWMLLYEPTRCILPLFPLYPQQCLVWLSRSPCPTAR